jgi:diacylglycerol kinase
VFGELSYLGYTALFCIPPLVLVWLRREFLEVLRPRLRAILISTAVITLYGSLLWPVFIRAGAWAYGEGKLTGVELFDYVYLDDLVWWILVSFLLSTFVTLSSYHEARGTDIVVREARALLAGFRDAFRGFQVVPLERNSTIHVAVAVFVLLEGALLGISRFEWLLVAVVIGGVIGFELINGAIERLASRIESRDDPEIRRIKDAAAAGVLIFAIAAAAVGLAIFLRRILSAVL